MPSISVIIPCYNVAGLVGRCLESIAEQTIPIENIEIICINDGSTDNTYEVLQQWEEKYPDNLLIVNCEENNRPGYSRNLGLNYATAKWIAFVDSDDWIEKEYLERLFTIGEADDYDVVACKSVRDSSSTLSYLNRDGRSKSGGNKYVMDTLGRKKGFFHCQPLTLNAWGKLIRREFLIENGILFPEGLAYEDVLWGNLLHIYANKAYKLDEELYHYYVNPDSIVLRKNGNYHTDHLTVQEMMWNDWVSRGLFENYRNELEYEYVYNGYLAFLKILAYRYEEPQYSLFQLLQFLTSSKISYNENPYLEDGVLPEFHEYLLKMSVMKIGSREFAELIEAIRKIGM